MNNFEEDAECIKSDKVTLNFFNMLIYPTWDQGRLRRGMRDVRKQSSLHFYSVNSLGKAANRVETFRINLAMTVLASAGK